MVAPTDWVRGRPYYDRVRVSAKADYAIRAMVELAAADGGPLKAERIAQAQEIPLKFLENIMADLRQGGLVRSQRGTEGGYWLARRADDITDRKSTRLNSSHVEISYAVFCLKK